MKTCRVLLGLLSLAAVGVAAASDRWETDVFSSTDDTSSTLNFVQHGAQQAQHDFDFDVVANTPDQDWYAFKEAARHSYEARVNGGLMYWSQSCTGGACPRFDRVNVGGSVLTPGQVSSDDADLLLDRSATGNQTVGRGMSVRWIADNTDLGFLRARADETYSLGLAPYDFSFRDTTYFAPRWNNSGTQISILLVQNATTTPITGEIYFYNAAGTLLHTAPLALPANGVQVLSTAAIGVLAGQSGSATIAHLAGYGALAGKVVALEPATGFAFDTAITPMPY